MKTISKTTNICILVAFLLIFTIACGSAPATPNEVAETESNTQGFSVTSSDSEEPSMGASPGITLEAEDVCETYTFDEPGLSAGKFPADFYDNATITSDDQDDHPAYLFDSSNPTGGDTDLGTPNEDFGGPGEGSGGGEGASGQNDMPLGNILIVNTTADGVPNDYNKGGILNFEFETPVYLSFANIIDVDGTGRRGEEATLRTYDENGVVDEFESSRPGENGVEQFLFNTDVPITSLEVDFSGATAGIDVLGFCEFEPTPEPTRPTQTIGD